MKCSGQDKVRLEDDHMETKKNLFKIKLKRNTEIMTKKVVTKVQAKPAIKYITKNIEVKQKKNDCPEEDLTCITKDMMNQIIGVSQNPQSTKPKEQRNATAKDKETREVLRFNRYDKGPFVVMMEKEDISLLEAARDVCQTIGRANMEEVKKISASRVKVVTKTWDTANRLIDNDTFTKVLKYKTYIQEIYLTSTGVIDEIPISFDEAMVQNEIEASAPITKIERMKRYNPTTNEVSNMDKIKIEFRSYTLPKTVKIYGANFRVRLFVPNPTFCRNCLCYGHFNKICRNKQRCPRCAQEITDPHQCEEFCKYCETNSHKTNDKSCPEKKMQIKIKTKMVETKCSYTEARKMIDENEKENFPRRNFDHNEQMKKTMAQTVAIAQQCEELRQRNDKLIDLVQIMSKVAFNKERHGKDLIEDIRDLLDDHQTIYVSKD